MKTRRFLIWLAPVFVLALAALAALVLYPRLGRPLQPTTPDYWPTGGWQNSTPEEQGFDSVKLAEGLEAIRQNGSQIHSLMLVRSGRVFLDAFFYPYDGAIYHDVASVTKSVMTTLIGIAADQGKLDLDRPMLSYFPDRQVANRSELKESITVRHLASMTSGLKCDPRDDELDREAMFASPDWVQFSLDRRVVYEPGTHFVYCGLGSHLLSAILQESTGMTALEFARLNLFEPLGIHDVYWPADPQGYNHGWGDLNLRPPDMARLGFLFLHNGLWEGRQIVSAEWVGEATTRQTGTAPRSDDDYGYGWWVSPAGSEFMSFRADGRNGQYIVVVPALDLLVVTTGGGFEMDEIDSYFVAAIGDTEEPLPENPAGVARLAAIVAELGQPPAVQPVPPPPQTAQAISGRTYTFEPNALKLLSARLDFSGQAEAVFQFELGGEPAARISVVGLDGVVRPSRQGRPVYSTGRWKDDTTFVIDYDEGPGLQRYTVTMVFTGDHIRFKILGICDLEGTAQ
jgi:CubicO group peptidase (beta-lactamase class C family)